MHFIGQRTFDGENGGQNRIAKYVVDEEIWWSDCLGLKRGYWRDEISENG